MSPSISHIGGVVWPVFWCNVICWVIVYLCICNGVKTVGKVSFRQHISRLIFLGTLPFCQSHKINVYFFVEPLVLRIVVYLCFADRVLYGTVSLRRVRRAFNSRRHVAWRLEGHSVLHTPGLGTIEET